MNEHDDMIQTQEAMLTTELGLTVPVKEVEAYRVHTAKNWKSSDPASYEFALYLVRELGITNKSKIVEEVARHCEARGVSGVSRNSVIALFNSAEFKPGEIDEIIRRRSSLLSADALDKIEELLDKAKAAKDLGAASMALTAVYNVKQLSNGAATRISGNTQDHAKARTFEAFLQKAREKMKLQDAPPAVEVETVRVEVRENDEMTSTHH